MFPILINIGSLKIYTYGAFLLLGFFWSCFLIWRNIRISKYDEETAFDIVLASFASSLVFGRIFYVVLHFADFKLDILKIILVNGYPGISVLGMIIGFITTAYVTSQIKKIKVTEFIDYITPSLLLFSGIGEIGSFFTGSEPGKKWDWFTHPVSLYGAAILLIGAYLSQKILYGIRKDTIKKGLSFLVFVWIFSFSYLIQYATKDKRALWTENTFEYWIFSSLLLTLGIYFVYYFKDLIVGFVKQFINWNIKHVKKIVKTISSKTKKHH